VFLCVSILILPKIYQYFWRVRLAKTINQNEERLTLTVETVVRLSKGEIDSKNIRVEFSLEDMDTSGLQQGATYGQIKERVLEQTGLKVSSLYIAQVKQKCGIIERESYNKPKSEDARQPQCPPEKEAAIMDALRHFRMI
jgi:23S rRNA (uracil1939-C5)-methyltransferase